MLAPIELGRMLRRYRKTAQKTQRKLAEELGWHASRISAIENGHNTTLETLYVLVRALKIPARELLTGTECDLIRQGDPLSSTDSSYPSQEGVHVPAPESAPVSAPPQAIIEAAHHIVGLSIELQRIAVEQILGGQITAARIRLPGGAGSNRTAS